MAFDSYVPLRSVRPMLVVSALLFVALVATSVAHADPGAVVLRSGARFQGDVVAVLPGDRVIVVLPDGTSMTFVWADVSFVFDGPRLYDSQGNTTTIDRAPSVAPPPTVVPVPDPVTPAMPSAPPRPPAGSLAVPLPFDPRLVGGPSIPRLAGTRAMFGIGGFFFISGVALFITQASLSRNNDTGLIAAIFTPPAVFGVGLGGGLWARGSRRMAIRRRFLPDPRSRDALFGQRPEFRLGVSVDRDAVVPQLTMRF